MVLGDLADTVPVDLIGTAVAHVDHGGQLALDQGRHQGGAHALKFLKLARLIEHGGVCQPHSGLHDLAGAFLGHTGHPGTLNLLDKDLSGHLAGHVAGLGAAHAITDHTQQGVLIQLRGFVSILILAADTAPVCQSPMLQVHHSLL